MALAACATWRPRACGPGPLRHRSRRRRGLRVAVASAQGAAERTADRARADGHASDVGCARIALGASLVDRPALTRVARARAGGPLRVHRLGYVHGRARAARRPPRAGARRSSPPGRRAARRRPAAAAARGPPGSGTACARCPRCRARLAQPAVLGARPLRDLRAGTALELGPRAQIVVTVPPVRTKHALRTGSYDLRALARPARLLVLAWNEHGPRSEPGPVASLAFWKQTLRTVLRPPRARACSWACRPGAGAGVRVAGAGAEQATQAQLFPEATELALQRPYGARWASTPGSSPTAPSS